MGDHRRLTRREGRPPPHRLPAGAARRGRDRRRLAGARPLGDREQVAGPGRRIRTRAPQRHGQRPLRRHAAGCLGASRLPDITRAARVPGLLFAAAGRHRAVACEAN